MQRPRPGDRISEYILLEKLGTGTFGEVWKARHHVWNEELVAVKIPTDPQYVRNLQHEGVTIHGLRHPNIVRAIGMDPYASPPYLIMELVDGESLRQRIDREPLGISEAVTVFRQVLEGLRFAHDNGVLHGDVKPANILITGDGVAKLTDFGLGRAQGITTQSIMQSGSLLTAEGRNVSGTLAYMAPEQQEGAKIDERADLYSAGIVLFEMLTGARPAGGELPSQVRSDVPKWIDDVFARCYTRYERRYGSAAEILRSLEWASRHKERSATRGRPETGPAPHVTSDGRCPACGQKGDPDDQFCVHCGQQLVGKVMRCPQCGAFPDRADLFCIHCGASLAAAGAG